MLTCPTEEELAAYVAHPSGSDAIAHHLDICAACRVAVAKLAELAFWSGGTPTAERSRAVAEGTARGGLLEIRRQDKAIGILDGLSCASTAPRSQPLHPAIATLKPGSTLKHYEILRTLGEGGMGVVYLARDTKLGRLVAVKVLLRADDRNAARFLVEARSTARCKHENIVVIYEVDEAFSVPYMVLEYLEGRTLRAFLAERRRPLPLRLTVELMLPVLRALGCAHALGLVHRDLKPENVFLTEAGRVVVLDFGIAKQLEAQEVERLATQGATLSTSAALTQQGMLVGTLPYMAPEQWRAEKVDPRTDLWAVGIMLFELCTGTHPLAPFTVEQLFQVERPDVPMPRARDKRPDVGALGEVIERCLKKRPEERFRSSEELIAALEPLSPNAKPPALRDLCRALPEGSGEVQASRRTEAGPAAVSPEASTRCAMAAHNTASASMSLPSRYMVGRGWELGLLLDRWSQVKEGQGQVALVTGEAGIGKSRFIQELKDCLFGDAHQWIECCCAPEDQNSALRLIIELVDDWLEVSPAAPVATRLDALEGLLRVHGFSLPEAVPLFAGLLSLPFEARYAPLLLSPEGRRQKLLDTIATLIAARAEQQPVVFMIEDLHWADPSLLDLVSLLIPHAESVRLLVLLTARPVFVPPWSSSSMLQLRLKRLTDKQATELLEQAARGARIPPELSEQMLLKADGVPLFLEELTRMVVERGEACGDGSVDLSIPETLRDSLNERLDRLGPARTTAQLASALGREFSQELLRAVSPLDDHALEASLSRLCGAELLHRRGTARGARYTFKHRLIQDTAYASMEAGARQAHHRNIARVLEEGSCEQEPARPEVLAHHYAEGGQHVRAVAYVQKAGQLALQRSANQEAIAHVKKGIQWAQTHAAGREQLTLELGLQSVLLPALFATRGYAATEVEQTLERALSLCAELGDTPKEFASKWGLWVCYTCQGRHVEALAIARGLLPVAERAQSLDWILEARVAIGHSLYYFPDLVEGPEQMERALAIYDFEAHRGHVTTYGQDPAVLALSFLGIMQWLRGYPDRAVAAHRAGRAVVEKAGHLYTTSFLQGMDAIHHQLRREPDKAHAIAGALIEQATLHVYPFWGAIAQIIQGWASVARGGRSLDQIRAGIAAFRGIDARNGLPYYLMLLAESEAAILGPAPALATLDEAARVIEQTQERRMEADLHRLRGMSLLARDPGATGDAEACFHRAIDVARAQGARSLELRATLDLSRLWQRRGRAGEAKSALGTIYAWFTEGVDTPDLVAARQLLGEL